MQYIEAHKGTVQQKQWYYVWHRQIKITIAYYFWDAALLFTYYKLSIQSCRISYTKVSTVHFNFFNMHKKIPSFQTDKKESEQERKREGGGASKITCERRRKQERERVRERDSLLSSGCVTLTRKRKSWTSQDAYEVLPKTMISKDLNFTRCLQSSSQNYDFKRLPFSFT